MSYSLLAIKRRKDFDGKNYKKLLKYVYYYGKPGNNRNEYFAADHLVFEWIRRTIHWNLSINYVLDKKNTYENNGGAFKLGILSLDYILINWFITFHIDQNKCWFIGPVLVGENKIFLKSKQYDIIIDYGSSDSNIYHKKIIKFIGPVPQLQSTINEGDTTYFFNVKWDNSYAEQYGNIIDYETIEVNDYKMYIENRAVILPIK